ncbi:methyltransferase domain-containing protein [Variovorax guangxiensis]|uniref:class I SAM-dependent methyltransferase n=1 Tax=Variovorax guangxiensis TaxID=1775474 RepID=UPI00285F0BA3|nr:methyltransferase domain-containing protein [Variovorax guangxiensis]MDR6856240.1 2-polyprenyl-3-methyl-5-hydroxy-6-metoxy-1,4-benzoquinol methylase [Variovorax guangxiensis]
MDAREVAKHWEANAEAWTCQVRRGLDVFRYELNRPAFFAMLPPVRGLRGLDVGCGEGANTRQLARWGARMVAIEVQERRAVLHAHLSSDAERMVRDGRQGGVGR